MTEYQDAYYFGLVALAERFRTSNPPEIGNTIRCLLAVFELNPPAGVEARVHSQLGNIYLSYTENVDCAKYHLEKAINLAKTFHAFDDILADASSSLAQLFRELGELTLCKQLLWESIEILSRCHDVMCWLARLIFQLVDVQADERDYSSAVDALRRGFEYATRENCLYLKIVFLLNISQFLMLEGRLQELHGHMEKAAHLIDAWQGDPVRRSSLRAWFMVIQTSFHILGGDCKSARPCLRDLQQVVISMADAKPSKPSQPSEHFLWIPKEQLCIVVYALTVLHSAQSGHFEKSRQYAERALLHVEKIRRVKDCPLLSNLRLVLLHGSIACNLGTCNYVTALKQLDLFKSACQESAKLFHRHGAVLHLLLGFYAVSLGNHQAAEQQFAAALRINRDPQLSVYINLNLAVSYLQCGRESEFYSLMGINPDRVRDQSMMLRVSSLFVRGMHLIMQSRCSEAKRTLCDALELANRHDLSRLTSFCLALVGQMLLRVNPRVEFQQECQRLLESALHLAQSNGDVAGQIWTLEALKNLCIATGNSHHEEYGAKAFQLVDFVNNEQERCRQLREHQLINVTDVIDRSKDFN
uniref:MAU2 chromatid cohesion factor homolog n=1 Tax=Trichuris muris TaxID=70415 RepID=A0A5S6R1S4_TRIMR